MCAMRVVCLSCEYNFDTSISWDSHIQATDVMTTALHQLCALVMVPGACHLTFLSTQLSSLDLRLYHSPLHKSKHLVL